jgi:hypothetical protein
MPLSLDTITSVILAICILDYVSRRLGGPHLPGNNFMPLLGELLGVWYIGYHLGVWRRYYVVEA